MSRRSQLGAAVAALVLAAGSASSQDSHYWTEQFGNRARLLGGAFIGGGSDIAVVYYNPGALALMDKPEILLAGNVFEMSKIEAEPVSNDAEGSTSRTLSLSPSLFAGQLRREVLGGKFAYSFLTRSRADTRLNSQTSATPDALQIPNISFVTNNTLVEQDVGDHWLGGTWSRAVGEKVGLGVSTFFGIRSQTARFQDNITALADDNRAATSSVVRDFTYYNVRLLWKIGLATHWERWQLGFTATTPSLSLFGSGTSTFDSTQVVQGVSGTGKPITFVAADRQNVSSEYRSPLSIGAGAARQFGATKLFLSMEWFDSVGEYTVLDTDPFEAQSSGQMLSSDVTQAFGSVTNFAIGVEHTLAGNRRLYGSFWTDFNAAAGDASANTASSPYNLYHFGGGYSFEVGTSDVTLGAVVARGSAKTNFDFNASLEDTPDLDVSFLRVTFLLGFNFALGPGS